MQCVPHFTMLTTPTAFPPLRAVLTLVDEEEKAAQGLDVTSARWMERYNLPAHRAALRHARLHPRA